MVSQFGRKVVQLPEGDEADVDDHGKGETKGREGMTDIGEGHTEVSNGVSETVTEEKRFKNKLVLRCDGNLNILQNCVNFNTLCSVLHYCSGSRQEVLWLGMASTLAESLLL